MTHQELEKERLNNLKHDALVNMYGASSCKDILKKAMKIRYPKIPDKANERLVSKLLFLDNHDVLQMGDDEIMVAELIADLIEIIIMFMYEIDEEYNEYFV